MSPPEALQSGSWLALQWPWALGLLMLGPLLALPLLGRPSRRWSRSALALRLAALLLVVLGIAGLALQRRDPAAAELCVVISTDVSDSVGEPGSVTASRLGTELAQALGADDRLGELAFAREAAILAWPAAPPRAPEAPASASSALDGSATRLAAGIEAALPLCPEGVEKKIVLVSDGNQTFGDARRAAAAAKAAGVRIYAVVSGATGGPSLSLEKLVAPPLVREGAVFPLRAMVRNRLEHSTEGTLDVLLDGRPVARQSVRFDPGINVFEVPYQLHERGSYRLGAQIRLQQSEGGAVGRAAGAATPPPEPREVSLTVAGPIRVLLLGGRKDSPLYRALTLRRIEVERRDPSSFPKLEDLLQFHCVLLDDVPRKALSDEALETLEAYVRTFGGGLVMAGGARSFGDKGFQKTSLERLLPVSLVEQEPKPKGRASMGVFLVLDRSNSMGSNSRRRDIRDGEKMEYAKQAARALVEQLRDEDRVGVIAFDSDPYVLGPLRPLSEHRAQLLDRIGRLRPGGGTDFKAALEIATAQLASSGLKVLHVILLTDGDTNRGADDHYDLVRTMARLGISVTTIRIGDDEVNLKFLQYISDTTAGRFYHVDDIQRLPQLVVADSKRAGGQGKPEAAVGPDAASVAAAPTPRAVTSPAAPHFGAPSEIVRGLAEGDLPAAREVVETRLKSGADRVLYVESEADPARPLLAAWQYGLGRAVAFPFDPAQPDAVAWAAWDGFPKLWSQVVRWTMREETPWETHETVRYEEGRPYLEVQTFDDVGEGTLSAQLFTAPERPTEIALLPVSPRLFRAALPPLAPGRYALLLTRRIRDRELAQKRALLTLDGSGASVVPAENARLTPDLELLHEIAAETGGTVDPTIDEIVARRGVTRVVRQRLDGWLLAAALVCLLGDIALRRRAVA